MPIDKSLEDLQRLVKAARIVGKAPPHEIGHIDVFGTAQYQCFFCGSYDEDGHTENCAWVVFREVTGG